MSIIVVAGRFTRDAEIRHTPKGTAVAAFGIAENVYRDGVQEAQFYNCQIWGERAAKIAPYIKKGGAATVSGTLQIREYKDKSGTPRTAVEINTDNVTLQGNADNNAAPAAKVKAAETLQPIDDIDNDIPF